MPIILKLVERICSEVYGTGVLLLRDIRKIQR